MTGVPPLAFAVAPCKPRLPSALAAIAAGALAAVLVTRLLADSFGRPKSVPVA
jgi:hypothetical protein